MERKPWAIPSPLTTYSRYQRLIMRSTRSLEPRSYVPGKLNGALQTLGVNAHLYAPLWAFATSHALLSEGPRDIDAALSISISSSWTRCRPPPVNVLRSAPSSVLAQSIDFSLTEVATFLCGTPLFLKYNNITPTPQI